MQGERSSAKRVAGLKSGYHLSPLVALGLDALAPCPVWTAQAAAGAPPPRQAADGAGAAAAAVRYFVVR